MPSTDTTPPNPPSRPPSRMAQIAAFVVVLSVGLVIAKAMKGGGTEEPAAPSAAPATTVAPVAPAPVSPASPTVKTPSLPEVAAALAAEVVRDLTADPRVAALETIPADPASVDMGRMEEVVRTILRPATAALAAHASTAAARLDAALATATERARMLRMQAEEAVNAFQRDRVQVVMEKPVPQPDGRWLGRDAISNQTVLVRTSRHAPEKIQGTMLYLALTGEFVADGFAEGTNGFGARVRIVCLKDAPDYASSPAGRLSARSDAADMELEAARTAFRSAVDPVIAAQRQRVHAAHRALVAAYAVALRTRSAGEDDALASTIPERTAPLAWDRAQGGMAARMAAVAVAAGAPAALREVVAALESARVTQEQAVRDAYTVEVDRRIGERSAAVGRMVLDEVHRTRDLSFWNPAQERSRLLEPITRAIATLAAAHDGGMHRAVLATVERLNAGIDLVYQGAEAPVALAASGDAVVVVGATLRLDGFASRDRGVSFTVTRVAAGGKATATFPAADRSVDGWAQARQERRLPVVAVRIQPEGIAVMDRTGFMSYALTADVSKVQAGMITGDTDIVLRPKGFLEVEPNPVDDGPRLTVHTWGEQASFANRIRGITIRPAEGVTGRVIEAEGTTIPYPPTAVPNAAGTVASQPMALRGHPPFAIVEVTLQRPDGSAPLRCWRIDGDGAYLTNIRTAIDRRLVVVTDAGTYAIGSDRIEVMRSR